jgi:acetylornithine deacetylase
VAPWLQVPCSCEEGIFRERYQSGEILIMRISRDYVTTVLADLVELNSINPVFSDGATDEHVIAEFVAGLLEGIGLDVTTYQPEAGRVSVVGRLAGTGSGPSLMLYGHMDTVGVEGMDAPFSARVHDGRLYGRGAYDMKGGLAACIAAVKALQDEKPELSGDVLIAAVADEEVASIGMQDVLQYVTADAAIVTEPTELEICLAHKGFCWIDVITEGRAAHGSRVDLGIDANLRMGRFLGQLELLEQQLRTSYSHPLVGPPSLHAAVLRGGTGPSTYAAQCRLEIERRTIPGETKEQVIGEIEDIVRRLSADDPTFKAQVHASLWRDPFEVSPDAGIVNTLKKAAVEVLGHDPVCSGQTPWMDAAFLGGAGIETVVMGPSGAGAHAAEEWVDIDSVVNLAEILARTAEAYCA